jgi:2-keto-3-deoxy-L-rhamnonate aldolase RhmA
MTGEAMTGFGADSRGVWCQDASPGTVARLARSGFDWVCLDAQHGVYGRAELLETARAYPFQEAELVVRVASCDFAAIGAALDVGATTVIVPQIESPEEAERAVAATYYAPRGSRSWGQLGRTWGRTAIESEYANAQISCAVMIESAVALDHVEAIAEVPGVSHLFVGPYDLSLSLGTTVEEMLADRSADSALARIVAAAHANGLGVGAYGGSPSLADRFRAYGISCLVVATDLWLLAKGAESALSP